MPPYEWGMMGTPYSPKPDIAAGSKGTNWDAMLNTPKSDVTMIDRGRQQEVDDFYKVRENKFGFHFLELFRLISRILLQLWPF